MIIEHQSTEQGMTIIYAICLVGGLIFTLLSAVVGHLFGGHGDAQVGTDGQADGGVGHDGVPGISFLSPTVLASFVTAFGALRFDLLQN
jgi:hypothetical protein